MIKERHGSINSLDDLYRAVRKTMTIRKKMVKAYFKNRRWAANDIRILQSILDALNDIPKSDGNALLDTPFSRKMKVDVSYEIKELEKDIEFLSPGRKDSLTDYLARIHTEFASQVRNGVKFLSGFRIRNLVTDRDGTINNYCARYRTSVQSIYNAVYLTSFAQALTGRAVILSSAPLRDMLDVVIDPFHLFIHAGSKGREFMDEKRRKHIWPLTPQEKKILKTLNERISALLKEGENRLFLQIGSGFQQKFGQTTIAYQDTFESVPKEKSRDFIRRVREIIRITDPECIFFRTEETGKDLEILLTVKEKDRALKDFDKGDGVLFIDGNIEGGILGKTTLVCGDTFSDLPMLRKAMERGRGNIISIFVTGDTGLRNQVASVCPESFFTDNPDILVAILFAAGLQCERRFLR
ncbi:MAG: hypothetical protein JW881_09395 [Spirochaetales bacterium]|nr:hypothetical protein [Spirochaetales bacterium]